MTLSDSDIEDIEELKVWFTQLPLKTKRIEGNVLSACPHGAEDGLCEYDFSPWIGLRETSEIKESIAEAFGLPWPVREGIDK